MKKKQQILIKRWLRSKMRRIARQTWQLMKPSFSEGKLYFQITLKHLHSDCRLFLYSPQAGQIGVYKDALERLNTSIAFNASDLDLAAAVWLMCFVISLTLILSQLRLV